MPKPCGSATRGRPQSAVDWQRVAADLDGQGYAVIEGVVDASEATALAALYQDDVHFRSRIIMKRHGFGQGEYKYLRYPLPDVIARLRRDLYPPLASIANRWAAAPAEQSLFPATHEDYLGRCHAGGQTRPTPLLLRYEAGDYNCLHQDIYGDLVFPLQATLLLSRPGEDFTGGEFVLTEQRPRMQSRASVVPLSQGDAVVFAVRERPVQGSRGTYRVKHRHGVSVVRSGQRFTAGIIFHDAV